MEVIRKETIERIHSDSFKDVFTLSPVRAGAIDGKTLVPSKYNIERRFSDDKTLIYNTASDSIVLLTEEEYCAVFKRKDDSSNYNDIIDALVKSGMLVPNNESEDLILGLIRQKQIIETGRELKIAINTTYDCNARCSYCFECESERKKMSPSVVEDVAEYLCRSVDADDFITYRWFGGEPLIAADVIDRIIHKVNDHFNNRINYRSVILSNGTICNDSIIRKILTDWRVEEFHVTIDGNRELHNWKKHFLDSSFDGYGKLIQTIQILLNNGIRVVCRINVDKENIGMLEEIITDFEEIKNRQKFEIYVAPVRRHTPEVESICFDYEEYEKVFQKTFRVLFEHGLLHSIDQIVPKRKITCCSTRASNELVVDTEGRLFKCMQTATDDQHTIGSCQTGLEYNEELSKWLFPKEYEECKDCIYMPICQGGCKGFRSLNNPLISPCVIEKYYMDVILDYTRKIYEREKHDNN